MNEYMKFLPIVIIVVVVAIFGSTCLFIVEEGQQAVVKRFGKIEATYVEAGLKFKMPVDTVSLFPKKILSWDGEAKEIPTEQSEAQFIFVDTTARWKIVDLKRFIEKVKTVPDAMKKLDDVIDSSVRTIISRNLLIEAVRSSINSLPFVEADLKDAAAIISELLGSRRIEGEAEKEEKANLKVSQYIFNNMPIDLKRNLDDYSRFGPQSYMEVVMSILNHYLKDPGLYDAKRFDGIYLIEHAKSLLAKTDRTPDDSIILNKLLLEAAYSQYFKEPSIKKGRETLSKDMLDTAISKMHETDREGQILIDEKTGKPLNKFGIELIDIIIRQIKYSDALTKSVYNRMIKERNQIAEKIRAEGEAQRRALLGKMNGEVKTIISTATATSEATKGEGDATATRTYAEAYGQNPEFFKFWRSLESYKKTLPNFRKILSTEAEYFDYLYKIQNR